AGPVALWRADTIHGLRQQSSNSAEGSATGDEMIAECEVLKRRVERLLGAAAEFSAQKTEEEALVEAVRSLAGGVGAWWQKRHVSFCEKRSTMGVFTLGVLVCHLAGAGGTLSVVVPGAVAGGRPVVDRIKAVTTQSGPQKD